MKWKLPSRKFIVRHKRIVVCTILSIAMVLPATRLIPLGVTALLRLIVVTIDALIAQKLLLTASASSVPQVAHPTNCMVTGVLPLVSPPFPPLTQ